MASDDEPDHVKAQEEGAGPMPRRGRRKNASTKGETSQPGDSEPVIALGPPPETPSDTRESLSDDAPALSADAGAETAHNWTRPPMPRGIPSKWLDLPRLNISDNLERYVFMAVLVIGAVIIWFGEYFELVSAKIALLLAIVGIGLYGTLAFTRREYRVRLDRAGDNCYYLGLTYTLVSLSVALVRLKPGVSPDVLISAFGIAVGSTIVGVIARLVLIQFRVEVDDIEARARVELSAAADALRAQLSDAVARFQGFLLSVQDAVRASVLGLTDDQIDRQRKLIEGVNEILVASITAITQSTTTIESSLSQHADVMVNYESAAKRSADAAIALADKLSRLAVPEDLVMQGFSAIKSELAGSSEALNRAVTSLERASSGIQSSTSQLMMFSEKSNEAAERFASTSAAIAGLQASLTRLADTVSTQVERLAGSNSALEGELVRLKSMSLDYAAGLNEVAQFLAKEIGRRGA